MTLENAIVYYSEMAKECRRKARIESNDYMDMKDCAYEDEQLADWLNELKVLRERIDAQPERKTGQWIEHENADIVDGYYVPKYECSCCHTWKHDDSDYCPDCGTKMCGTAYIFDDGSGIEKVGTAVLVPADE